MSQEGVIDIIGTHPEIPTLFIANIGSAAPIANTLEILGDTVLAGAVPVFTTGSGNTITTNVQISQAIAAPNPLNVGLASFNSSQFTVDADGFVQLIGGGVAIDSVATNVGGPIFPDGTGQISILGTIAAFSGNPLRSNGTVANTVSLVAQVSSAQATSVMNNAGMASFDSSMFTVDANGFVSLLGGSLAIDSIAVQTGASPIVPTGAGLVIINGSVVAAGTNPIRTNGTGANTLALEVQISQALAAADATKIGLSNFSSIDFSVAATGFVTLNTTGAGKTITGDSGGALSPTGNNWNIFGLSGSKTSGSGSTLTIKSPPYTDQGGSTTVTLNSGSFATAAITLTTPATAALADGDLLQFVATNGVLVIQLAATQVAHIGSLATTVAGTLTSTLTGDSVSLRYQASTNDWWAISVIGTWILA